MVSLIWPKCYIIGEGLLCERSWYLPMIFSFRIRSLLGLSWSTLNKLKEGYWSKTQSTKLDTVNLHHFRHGCIIHASNYKVPLNTANIVLTEWDFPYVAYSTCNYYPISHSKRLLICLLHLFFPFRCCQYSLYLSGILPSPSFFCTMCGHILNDWHSASWLAHAISQSNYVNGNLTVPLFCYSYKLARNLHSSS